MFSAKEARVILYVNHITQYFSIPKISRRKSKNYLATNWCLGRDLFLLKKEMLACLSMYVYLSVYDQNNKREFDKIVGL